jgi:hypothetical protein
VIKQEHETLLKIISENNFAKFYKEESLGYQSGTYEGYRIFERVATQTGKYFPTFLRKVLRPP